MKTITITGPIYKRKDGSYVCTLNGLPYHADGNTERRPDETDVIKAIESYCEEQSITPREEPENKPDKETLAKNARSKRDALIDEVSWRISRYTDEVALGLETTETLETIKKIRTYIQALRDLPEQKGFPETIEWPKLS